MGRKKKEKPNSLNSLKTETLQSVVAILCFVLAFFFILSAFKKAGLAGTYAYDGLSYVFGVGFYLLPVVLITLGISFLASLKKHVARMQAVSGLILFISLLGIISISLSQGGKVGELIALPFLKLFDVYTSVIILGSLVIISLLLMFDVSLNPKNLLFWKKEEILDSEESEDDEEDDEKKAIKPQEALKTIPPPLSQPKIKKQIEDVMSDFPLQNNRAGLIKEYKAPPLSLLERDKGKPVVGDIKANANIIQRTLQNFGITVEMDEVSIGPSVTRYALKPAEGVKLSRIVGLQNDLSLALAAHPLRIEAPIPGKSLVGVEMPNSTKTTVGLGTLLASESFQKSDKPLLVAVGKDISGESNFVNLAKMPHLLIAGATGSGKSVTIHALITSLLYRNSPEQLKFIMIDPKRVELTLYNKIPHLLTPVITDAKKAILALKWAAKEMDRRYDILEGESVRDIQSYHENILAPALAKIKKGDVDPEEKQPETMPYMVVIIDELADIMQSYPRELEASIVRLAQMSRAVGIHLMLSTQRPSVNVITGLIKANVPSRIALQVASQIDSRTILD
ncbi:MAG: cell division protein ftsK, segregation ATPase FtsK/SpoIIIE, family, partial [Candidatus Parcubacteria bacterium]